MRRRTFLKTGAGTLATSLLIGNPELRHATGRTGRDARYTEPGDPASGGRMVPRCEIRHLFPLGALHVPAYDNEWYSRNMYVKGSAAYKYHVAKYGGPESSATRISFRSSRPRNSMPTNGRTCSQRAGAGSPAPWPSTPTAGPTGTASSPAGMRRRMGPKKDITGLMAAAVRKRNMKFIATFHHQWLWGWYPTMDKTVDCSNPEYCRSLRAGRPAQRIRPEQSPAQPRVLRALAGEGQ